MNENNIKVLVRGAYQIQKLRIQTGNRIVANFKAKLGQEPSMPEDELTEPAKDLLKDLRVHYKKITDGVKTFPRQKNFTGTEIISTYTELCLLEQYFDIETGENQHFKRLGQVLNEYPVYTHFLQGVKGIGPAMSGVIVSEIDINKSEYPSSIWMYCGLDVAPDGNGRSKKADHLVTKKYINSDGEEAERQGITFNPFLKSKLVGVLAPSFIKCANPDYSPIYYDYKNRLENHPNHSEKTKLHKHNMAMRYMIKRFLVDLYIQWRTIEKLPIAEEYSVAKLGIHHNKAA